MTERPGLDRDVVVHALRTMSHHLARAGTSADVWVYGGAANRRREVRVADALEQANEDG